MTICTASGRKNSLEGVRRAAGRKYCRITTEAYEPRRVAFLLLRDLYGWFGHTEEDVPYAQGEIDEKRIDTSAINAIG